MEIFICTRRTLSGTKMSRIGESILQEYSKVQKIKCCITALLMKKEGGGEHSW